MSANGAPRVASASVYKESKLMGLLIIRGERGPYMDLMDRGERERGGGW